MLRKALEVFEKLGRLEGISLSYGNLGLVYDSRGDLDAAEEMHRKALQINEKIGLLEGMANAYGNLGSIAEKRGDTAEARELWTKARELFERFCETLSGRGVPVRQGVFGAKMQVESVNSGPICLLLDSKRGF